MKAQSEEKTTWDAVPTIPAPAAEVVRAELRILLATQALGWRTGEPEVRDRMNTIPNYILELSPWLLPPSLSATMRCGAKLVCTESFVHDLSREERPAVSMKNKN